MKSGASLRARRSYLSEGINILLRSAAGRGLPALPVSASPLYLTKIGADSALGSRAFLEVGDAGQLQHIAHGGLGIGKEELALIEGSQFAGPEHQPQAGAVDEPDIR